MKIINYSVIRSLLKTFSLLLKRKNQDVVFYYPQHFNRGVEGENIFFKRMTNLCEVKKLNYLLVEEPDWNSDKPRNSRAIQFDFYFLLVLFLRKIIPSRGANFEKREQSIGYIVNLFSFGVFKSPVYITLSNSLGGVLRGINSDAEIYDYQHGIITSEQPGFFKKDGSVTELIAINNKKVLVYGLAFKEIFDRNDEYYKERVKVIGKPQTSKLTELETKGMNVLISFQILKEFGEECNKEQIKLVLDWIEINKNIITRYGIKIKINHHPRFNNCIDDSKLFKYEFVKNVTNSWTLTSDFIDLGLHLTFFSTTAFEYAEYGIPSIFLFSDLMPQGQKYFGVEYQYPFIYKQNLSEWDFIWNGDMDKREKNTEDIRSWYNKFFQPFDESVFLSLIKRSHEK